MYNHIISPNLCAVITTFLRKTVYISEKLYICKALYAKLPVFPFGQTISQLREL